MEKVVKCSKETLESLEKIARNENTSIEYVAKDLLGLRDKAKVLIVTSSSEAESAKTTGREKIPHSLPFIVGT